jgi:type II secretory pathway component PulJ
LVASVIAAILGAVLVIAVSTVYRASSAVTNQQIAVKQVQNAVDYISRDASQAQTTTQNYTDGSAVLSFTIPVSNDGSTFTNESVTYQVINGTLTRTIGTISSNISTNILSGGFVVHASAAPYYVSITSTVKGYRSEIASRVVLLEP